MTFRSSLALAVAFFPATVTAQSLGEAAARERAKREKRGSAPSRVFTDEDLKEHGKPPDKSATDGGAPASSGGEGSGEGSGEGARSRPVSTVVEGSSSDSAPSVSAGDEAVWRQRARDQRQAVRAAEQAIQDAQRHLSGLVLDREPVGLGDPNRMQTVEAQKNEARAALETARLNRADAQKAVQDLEDEARRNNVPPGWLREP